MMPLFFRDTTPAAIPSILKTDMRKDLENLVLEPQKMGRFGPKDWMHDLRAWIIDDYGLTIFLDAISPSILYIYIYVFWIRHVQKV